MFGEKKNIFVTGSLDKCSYLWDVRSGEAELSFTGHTSDINCVKFFPNGQAFASGSDDGTVRLYDLRGDRELMVYQQPDEQDIFKIFSLDFSKSGKYLFTACNVSTLIWDTATGTVVNALDDNDIISYVGVNPSGLGVVTTSWNNSIKIYA